MHLLKTLFSSFVGLFICWVITLPQLGFDIGASFILGLIIYYLPLLFAATLVTYFFISLFEKSGLITNFLLSIKGFVVLFGIFVLIIILSATKIANEDFLLGVALFFGLIVSTAILAYFEKGNN